MNPIQKITKEEFIRQYTKRSKVTMEQLREWGLEVYPCDCDYSGCQGWQVVKTELYEFNTKNR